MDGTPSAASSRAADRDEATEEKCFGAHAAGINIPGSLIQDVAAFQRDAKLVIIESFYIILLPNP
jgi:hypothetical protein